MTTKVVPEMFDFTAKGDVAAATGNDTVARLAVGTTSGQSLMVDSSTASGLRWERPMPTMFIQGLTYANSTVDATNDLDMAAGKCRDDTDTLSMTLSALTKQLDANWVVGTAQGALDTGAVGDNDYYIFAIMRSDTGVADYLFSLSSTAPTMPTDYAFKRLIGWFKRVGGTIVLFTTYETDGGGIELLWSAPTLDVNLAATLTTTRRTDAVKVPLTFSTIAHLNVGITDGATTGAWVYCPDQTDAAPSFTVAPLSSAVPHFAGSLCPMVMRIRTSATGTIAARATQLTDLYVVSTMGFTWARRN